MPRVRKRGHRQREELVKFGSVAWWWVRLVPDRPEWPEWALDAVERTLVVRQAAKALKWFRERRGMRDLE